jgi:Ribbon-helix-helix protein, copG family
VKKTSLYLDPDLDEAVARRAAEEGLTKAEFIRRTLAGALQRPRRPRIVGIGSVKDAPADLATNEGYLDGMGEWRSS